MAAAMPASLAATSVSTTTAASALATLRASTSQAGSARRDPRAAPIPVHKNVSVAETCRFYGAQDAISTCRVPRSCQDCLRMPHCGIATDGLCRDVSELEGGRDDYHLALAQYPKGDAYSNTQVKSQVRHAFYAANTTYCSESDAVCSQCRDKFQALARSPRTVDAIGTQFCVGVDGCVCVAVCEVPELLAVRAHDEKCSSKADAPIYKDPDGVDIATFSTRRRDPRAPLSKLVHRRPAESTCAFHGRLDIQGCRKPRSCSDCLQAEGCMVSLAEKEMCTSLDSYSTGLDFRNEPHSFSTIVTFPASDTTYCPTTDPVCAKCRQDFSATASNWTDLYDQWNHRNKSSFCIGKDGCVCIEQCEKIPNFVAFPGCRTESKGTPADFECTYETEKDAQGCLQPRGCSDCLQKKGCMIQVSFGVATCVAEDSSTDLSDYRLESRYITNTALQFPSNATNYCSPTDIVCAKCRDYFKATLRSDEEGNARAIYCVGEGGCVCIARCEIEHLFLMDAHDAQCSTASVRASADSFIILSSALLAIIFAIVWTLLWSRDKRANPEPEPEVTQERSSIVRGLRRHMLDHAPALHLDLYGWRRYYQQLRSKEQELLAGAEEVSPVARPVAFDFADIPTAPDFDDEEESTAPTVTNPHALASAPASDAGGEHIDPLVPSAPDFD